MTQMQNLMLSVCFGAVMGVILASWWIIFKDWFDKRKKKSRRIRIMTLIDWFVAIFIGTWLFDFVVKTLVSLYLDIRNKMKR